MIVVINDFFNFVFIFEILYMFYDIMSEKREKNVCLQDVYLYIWFFYFLFFVGMVEFEIYGLIRIKIYVKINSI